MVKKKLTISVISDAMNVSPSNLSGFLNFHRNYSEQKRMDLSGFFGKSYMEVLDIGRAELTNTVQATLPKPTMTAQATTTEPQRRKTDMEIQANKTHEKLVGNFTHKKEAYEVNNELLRLEKLEGRDALIEVKGMIKNMIREAEKKLGLDQGSTGTEGK